jgi:hypothetical protein
VRRLYRRLCNWFENLFWRFRIYRIVDRRLDDWWSKTVRRLPRLGVPYGYLEDGRVTVILFVPSDDTPTLPALPPNIRRHGKGFSFYCASQQPCPAELGDLTARRFWRLYRQGRIVCLQKTLAGTSGVLWYLADDVASYLYWDSQTGQPLEGCGLYVGVLAEDDLSQWWLGHKLLSKEDAGRLAGGDRSVNASEWVRTLEA